MQYRKFGKLDFEVSTLGFGCMRLPVLDGESGERNINIDEKESIRMIRYAIDNGVNYFDTAYLYNKGKSEIILGKALKDGYREKVKVATKIPIWLAKTHDDLYKILDEELERLDVEYIDMYLLHMLSHMNWEMVEKLKVFDFLDNAKKSGKIKHVGFSFHDGFHLFKEIINSYDWEFCYIQFNYLDENYQAGIKGLKYAYDKGLAVVIMEPLRGGSLVKIIPEDVKKIWNQSDVKRSPAEWGFRWVCNHPEVATVLSGMSNMNQLEENITTFSNALAGSLTNKELETINKVKKVYKQNIKVNCTQCNYCMPCPEGVYIRGIFNFYNNAALFNKKQEAIEFYSRMKKMGKDYSRCVGCRKCEKICPQHLPITELLKEAHNAFENGL
ncbi:aldo/keto reductase [Abyssisolibacter fermentans]|uniref:aldo/keto reductase n=1 Tax=Abyssisolibacter fermentans TaxID=1766203 RepID=UPI0008357E14|nr:aldo/keto reductase [Abyssisolibacter fermentans]